MTDSKKTSRPSGFEEAPQAPFEGAPLSDDVSAWADEISQEASKSEALSGNEEETLGDRTTAEWKKKEQARDEEKAAQAKKAKARAKKASDPTVGNKRTGGGTSIGGSNDPMERVAAGLNPVAGLNVSAEQAMEMASTSGVTATVQALSDLIEHGRDVMKGDIWVPHRPLRPDMDEDQKPFRVVSEFDPKGDQPEAIKELVGGLRGVDWNAPRGVEGGTPDGEIEPITSQDAEEASGQNLPAPAERRAQPDSVSENTPSALSNRGERTQVLLGVTGSGKTFTMAKVIEETQRPALILAPNKTLAAQLYGEFKSFFPNNAVEYFVSYYDYYQPYCGPCHYKRF